MHLFKLQLQKRHKIVIFILSAIICTISVYPLFVKGFLGAFFSIDPDVVYLANSLSKIKYGTFWYHDHPGVPSIYVISQSFLPLRLYAKFFLRQDFVDFVFENYYFITSYLRLFQSSIFFIGLGIFFVAIYKMTKNIIVVFLSSLILINYTPVLNMPWSISAEPLNILIISLWLLCLYFYLKHKNLIILNLLFILTGLLLANRTTNFIYLFSSLIIIFSDRKEIFRRLLYILIGFLLGVLPMIDRVDVVVKRMLFFASSAGVHGSNPGKIIDLNSYFNSLKIFWDRDIVFSVLVIVFCVLVFYFRFKIKPMILYLCTALVLTIFAFAKFPLQHYQVPNLLFLIFFLSYFMKNVNNKIIFIVIIILSYFSITNVNMYNRLISEEISKTVALEKFVESNPHQVGQLWEWARSKNFSYLWTNSYGNQIFSTNLKRSGVSLYMGEEGVFEQCWDQLYIQEVTYIKSKLARNDDLEVIHIPNTGGMLLIKSNHCSSDYVKKP